MLHIMGKSKKWLSFALTMLLFVTMILPTSFMVSVPKAQAAAAGKANHVVISQVFIGNGTSIYKNRFVELYNPTSNPVDVSTWSLQNTSATGTFSTITKLTGTIPAYGYYLIQCTAQTNTVGLDLPTPNVVVTASVNFGAAGAKIAIASKQTAITGSTDAAVVDFIGYGTATDSWGTVATANSNVGTTSYFRLTNSGMQPDVSGDGNGWDSKNNKNDFVFESSNPRNSSFPVGPSSVDLGSTTIDVLHTIDVNGLATNVGKLATITGVVTAENKVLGTENTNFYVQDSSGGINVIGLNNPAVTITKGHTLQISGSVAFTKGQTRFIANSIVDLGIAPALTPKNIRITDLSSFNSVELLEGNLVKFNGKVTAVTKLGSDYNVTVADESDKTAIVKVFGITGIDASNELVLNSSYTFTGIIGQSQVTPPYTTGYYLMIRNISDIRGEVTITHIPLTKGIPDVDLPFSAVVKNADTVTLYYKAAGDLTYKSIAMNAADAMNYNGSIPAANVPSPTFVYYIEAKGDKTVTAGPYTVDVGADTEGPTFSNALPAIGDTIETKHPEISVSMFDLSGVDAATAKIKIGNKDFTNQAIIKEDQIRLTLTTADDLPEGPNTIVVEAKDKVGNGSTYSWTFSVAQRFTGGNHYRGTTHNHTNISHDASGSPEDALKASQNYNYDFFAFSDHSHDIDSSLVNKDTVDHNGMPERSGGSDWQLTKDLAKQYTKDGSFVVFPAFEMTSTTWGHSNVFGTTDFIDRMQDGGKYQNLQNYYAWVLTYDNIVAQFNHPAMSANAFDNFIPYDKKVDKLFTMLEVGNGSGHYGYANAEDKLFTALDLGWHVAPTYGEDNHDATWGQTKKRTVIVSKDLTQESLLDSMRKMRVYFSEDPNAQLDVSASGWYMGSITDTKTLQFDINVSDAVLENSSDPKYSYLKTPSNDNIDKIEIVSNGGRVVDTISPSGSKTAYNWKPTVNVVGGQQWFVVRITQKDGDRIYSAPIWSPTDDLYVKVGSVTASEGSITGAVPTTLTASISNLGVINVKDLNVSFYYDNVDIGNKIGEAVISSLQTNKSATAQVTWANPIAGNHKIVVVLTAGDGNNIGDNKFEQAFTIKPPLGIKVLIDATHQNENTTTDTGKYTNNLTTFTSMMRKEGYTISENTAAITSAALAGTKILMLTHPATSYSTTEINAIKDFITGGGSVFVAEKSNGTALNNLLSGVGSTVLFNGDTIYDDSKAGNFWSTITGNEFAVRTHPVPLNNYLTDFVSVLDYYSGSSLAQNNAGSRAALGDTNNVSILVRGNETTYQQSAPSGGFTYKVGSGSTGGSQIPLVATETIGSGRLFIAGMNIFNDNQLKVSTDPNDNGDLALNAMKWLGHLDTKVTSIGDARKLAADTEVVVQGKVTSGAGVFYDAVYVQDDTGGIMAFSEIPEGSLKVGDTIRAYGHIKIFENNFELEFDKFANSIVKVSSGSPIQPKSLSTKNATLDENMGQLVKVFGEVTAIPDDSSYVLNDGSGDVLVFVDGYIASQSGVPIPKLKMGDKLSAIGLSGAFSEGTRIRVRDTRELIKTDALIPVTGIQLDKTSAIVSPGDSDITLTASVLPANATITSVIWSSSNEAVAKVNNGIVSIVGLGTATMNAETLDGGFRAPAVINVIPLKPNVRADIGAKAIVGIDSTMEYNIDGLGWTPYVAASPPNLSGEHTVQVRVKATGSVLAGQIKNLFFSTAAPTLTGFTWATGSVLGTKATAVPAGTLKYAVGAANMLYQPAVGELATDYTKLLMVNADIFASPGQHIYIVSVDGTNKISGWADITVSSTVTPATVAKWDFIGSTAFATDGILANKGVKSVSVVGAGGSSFTFTASGGVSSSAAVTAADWTPVPSYWTASLVTTGYSYIQVSSRQYSSGTGPRDFKLQYSLDGLSWSDVTNGAITVGNATWTTGGVLSNATLPAAANNQSNVLLRWLVISTSSSNSSTIATGGTSRLDDVIITGIPLSAAPSVSADDVNKSIIGINGSMEYNINNTGWIAYNSATPPELNGNYSVQVRLSAVGDVLPSLSKTLTFTLNAQSPAAPNVTADDVNNIILGIDATMEYSIDGGEWTTYNAATAANLSGNHSVQVRVKANGAVPAGQSTILTFTVNAIAVTGVTLTPTTLDLTVGGTQTLTATVAPATATNQAVTWSSNNASVATVENTGKVTAIGAGSATITVTTVDGGKIATTVVTVTAVAIPVPVTGVTLAPDTLDLTVGGTQTLTATVAPATATNQAVTWSSNNAIVATVDNTGKVMAVGAGSAAITVTTADGGKTATMVVTVTAVAIPVPVTGVTLAPDTLALTVGGTQTLTATVAPATATNQAVTWSSNNESVATVDNTGKVRAVGAGSAAITVTTADGGKYATTIVTVTAAGGGEGTIVALTGVSLNKPSVSMTVGDSVYALAFSITPVDATNQAVIWSSDNTSIVLVDSDTGKLTAVGTGTATITVTTVDGNKTAAAVVSVTAASVPITGVTLEKTTLSLTVGGTQTLAATLAPANATNKEVTWTSENTNVAKVDSNGKVTAIAVGTTNITVTTVDGSYKATIDVTVTAATNNTDNSGGNNTGTIPDVIKDKPGQVSVPADTIKNSTNGKSTVDVPANTTEIKLPSNTADLLAQNKLEVKSDKLTLEVPSNLIKQLTSGLSADALKNSTISLNFEPLSASAAKDAIAKGQAESQTQIKLAGEVYEFKLSVTNSDGSTVAVLSKFDQPITLHFKVDASINPKLAGVYYIADDGKLEFIGGQYSNGEMTVQISHFSKYAVLEVTKTFSDVPNGHWAADVIKELAAKQIVNGTSATTFEPGRSVTRAEFTSLLVRALKLTGTGQLSFTDVKSTDWYAETIAIAVKAGIVNGKSETIFDPNAQITREEMVTMMMRAYATAHGSGPTGNVSSTFTDEAEVSTWAVQFVNQAASLHLVQGRSAGVFDPKGITTRAEAAQVIYNVLMK